MQCNSETPCIRNALLQMQRASSKEDTRGAGGRCVLGQAELFPRAHIELRNT